MIKRIKLDYIILFLLFLLFICFTFIPFNFPNTNQQLWKNYYLLCVKNDFNYKEKLNGFVWEDIISYENTEVTFTVFNDFSEISLKDLDERFDEMDPRLDPYMNSLKNYFFGDNSWNYVFIPSDVPVQFIFINLFLSLPDYGTKWVISDFNITKEILSIIFMTAFFLFIRNLKKKNKIFISFSFISWMVIILTGSFDDLITFYTIFPALFLIIDLGIGMLNDKIYFSDRKFENNPDYNNLKGRFGYLILVVILSLFNRITNDNVMIEIIRILFPVFSCFSVLGLYFYFNKIKVDKSSHELFYSVPIIKRNKWKQINKPTLILLIVIMILVPILFSIEAPLYKIEVPVPKEVDGVDDFSWNSLKILNNLEQNTGVPDISDYVVHMAFQEGFIYGAEYKLPEADEELVLDSYKENKETGEIEKYYEVVFKFDQLWLSNVISEISKGSFEKLFIDQGKPVSISYNIKDIYFNDFSLWNCLVLIIFVVFPIFFFDYLWTSTIIYDIKKGTHELPQKAK